ncbi:hypothetical protein [Taibaiella soli]|nr:hypothetical protein [Taibaiella soli]
MSYEERQQNSNGTYSRFQSTLNIGMGLVYLLVGITIVYMKVYGQVPLGPGLAYTLGGLMIVYGVFRLWRGFMDIRRSRLDKVRKQFDDINKR